MLAYFTAAFPTEPGLSFKSERWANAFASGQLSIPRLLQSFATLIFSWQIWRELIFRETNQSRLHCLSYSTVEYVTLFGVRSICRCTHFLHWNVKVSSAWLLFLEWQSQLQCRDSDLGPLWRKNHCMSRDVQLWTRFGLWLQRFRGRHWKIGQWWQQGDEEIQVAETRANNMAEWPLRLAQNIIHEVPLRCGFRMWKHWKKINDQ